MSDKSLIMKTCSGFSKTQNIQVLKFLIEIKANICGGADGSRINLDKLSKSQLALLKKKVKELDKPIETKYQI